MIFSIRIGNSSFPLNDFMDLDHYRSTFLNQNESDIENLMDRLGHIPEGAVTFYIVVLVSRVFQR